MKIYTKTGDQGMTSLADGCRVRKSDARLEAYGTADELNSFVGLLRAEWGEAQDGTDEQLGWIQNRLFNLGALLAAAPGEWISEADSKQLEQWMDAMQSKLPVLRDFLLPGGSRVVSLCHVCRTVTRRLERNMCMLDEILAEKGENNVVSSICPAGRTFVNRLSDYFFLLSRMAAKKGNIYQFVWKKS